MSAPPAPVASTLTLGEAQEAIREGSVRHVTSDVFDTLVWRPVADPRDLFLMLARSMRTDGLLNSWVDDHTFALGRTRSEFEAREAATIKWGAAECTLEEIWERMPANFFTSSYTPDAGVEAEIEFESNSLKPHAETPDLVRFARSLDLGVTLVSDTYFSVAQLERLLARCGIETAGLAVVTSSSQRLGKADGLLEQTIGALGQPSQILHVGDNPVADVETAQRLGCQICFVDIPAAEDAIGDANDPWKDLSATIGSDGGRSAAIRSTLVASEHQLDPSYQFGVSVAGPIMAGFAGWASEQAEQLGASAIHCLLREGARIAELIDIVRPEGPQRVLVHASRWAIMRAAIIDGTSAELERALTRRGDLTAQHVSDAFGCDANTVMAVIGGSAIPRSKYGETCDAIASDDGLRSQILERSLELRRNTLRYLESTLVIDDGPIVVCDIGWGGTIQEGLSAILHDAGIENELVGLYAALSPTGGDRVGRGARMLGYMPTHGDIGESIEPAATAIRHPEFLERVNTPQIGTLLEFSEAGVPICRPESHDEMSGSLERAQQGVIDFSVFLANSVLTDEQRRAEWFGDSRFAGASLATLATTIKAPKRALALTLGTWHHDDVAGAAAEALSNNVFERWLPYANAVDAAKISMHDVYWFAGVAARSESNLGDQFDALAAGRDPNVVCPPSPTGLARIAFFEPGSHMAVAQIEQVPNCGANGWMLLQLKSTVRGLRSIRIDLGTTGLISDIGDVEIIVRCADRSNTIADEPADLSECSQLVEGRWLGVGRPVFASGGHLLINFDGADAADATEIVVSIGYRTWAAHPDEVSVLLPRWSVGLQRLRRRIIERFPSR